jgi:RIO-like serine/threonine protein kinase
MYRKEFQGTPGRDVAKEVRLQRISAGLGLSPSIRNTDNRTFMEMDNAGKCLADIYGDDAEDLPNPIREQVYTIIFTLYQNGIQYIDVTSYNFTEKDGQVWIIDFGHANTHKRLCPYLRKMFNEGYLHEWNADFK